MKRNGIRKSHKKDFINETSKKKRKKEFHVYCGEDPCSILQTRTAFRPYANTFEETCTFKVTYGNILPKGEDLLPRWPVRFFVSVVAQGRWCVTHCPVGAACPAFLCLTFTEVMWQLLAPLPKARFDPFFFPASPFPVEVSAFCHLWCFPRGGTAIQILCLSPNQGCGFPTAALVPLGSCSDATWVRPRATSSLCRFCVFFVFHISFLTHPIALKYCIFLSISGCLVKCQKYNCFRELVSFYVQKQKAGKENSVYVKYFLCFCSQRN